MITLAELAKLQSPEASIVQALALLGSTGLGAANYVVQPIEVKTTIEIPIPALGLGPNGLPQRRETVIEVANRIMSADEAAANFPKFALMFALGYDRVGKMLPMDIIDTGISPIAEAAGKNIRFRGNPESHLVYGLYYAETYFRAMANCDNNPGKFIKTLEQLMSDVEDFRMDRGDVLEILNKYPMARTVFNFMNNIETVYEMQQTKTDPRIVYENILGQIRAKPAGQYVQLMGINIGSPISANERLTKEEEAHVGYALWEAIGMRDAINHRKVLFDGANYRWSKTEEKKHIFGAPLVPDPFSAAAHPIEFVEYVKQKFGIEIGKIVGLEDLDVGYRTFGAELLNRAIARQVTVYEEMLWEEQVSEDMENGANFATPAGMTIKGKPTLAGIVSKAPAPPPAPAADFYYSQTFKRWPEGTIIDGIDLGGQEIAVGMIRNIKKHHKASDLWAALYKLYLNPYQKTDEPLVEAVNAASEYAREAFQDILSEKQRSQYVPKIAEAVMKVASLRGIPVNNETIVRTINSMKQEMGMYKGVGGAIKAWWDKSNLDGYNASAQAGARLISPEKGESGRDTILGIIKLFWQGK